MLSYKEAITTAKSEFYIHLFSASEGNIRILFSTVHKLFQSTESLPSHLYSTTVCNSFMDYFNTKKISIHKQIPAYNVGCGYLDPFFPKLYLSTFYTFNLYLLLMRLPASFRPLNPLPDSWILFQHT